MENENLTKSKKDKTLMIIIGVLSAVLIVLFVFFLVEKKENRENMIAITAEKEELHAGPDGSYSCGFEPPLR